MLIRAVHPGEILKGELEELEITPTAFARQIAVPPNRMSQIIAGKRSVTGSAWTPNSGLTHRRSTTWFWLTRRAAARSAISRPGTRFRSRQPRRALFEQ